MSMHHQKTKRPPSLREFVKYLNQTIELFEHHIPPSEFENTESKVHRLFVSLFNIYLENHPVTQSEARNTSHLPVRYPTLPEIEEIIEQHYGRKKRVPDRDSFNPLPRDRKESRRGPRICHQEIETSDARAQRLYRESLIDSQDDPAPIIEEPIYPVDRKQKRGHGLDRREESRDPGMVRKAGRSREDEPYRPRMIRDRSRDEDSDVITHIAPPGKSGPEWQEDDIWEDSLPETNHRSNPVWSEDEDSDELDLRIRDLSRLLRKCENVV